MADQDHQTEQEDQDVQIDGRVGVGERQAAERNHPDRAQQGGSRAVEVQPADPLDCDEEIGGDEDEQRRGHAAQISQFDSTTPDRCPLVTYPRRIMRRSVQWTRNPRSTRRR